MATIFEHVRHIQIRIETIAENESRPGENGISLDETLAALTEGGRRRATMLLDRIIAFYEDSNERNAADLIRSGASLALK